MSIEGLRNAETYDQVCNQVMTGIESGIDYNGDLTAKVTWARYPYRYVMTRYDVVTKSKGIIRGHITVATRGYILTRMSAQRSDTGLHEFSRYVILPGEGLQAAFHHLLPSFDALTEEDIEDHRAATDFEIKNHLGAPSPDDCLEVGVALKYARLDGYEVIGD